jgi:hypothetical protein
MNTTLLKLTENAALRGMLVEAQGVHEKDKWWFSVYDFINFVCDKKHNRTYAHVVFSRLTKEGSEYRKSILSDCKYCKFTTSAKQKTPCMSIRGLQRLLMILGGKVAAEYRKVVEGVFTRFMRGDNSLIAEIHANAASNPPLNQACRAALEQEPVTGKRKEMDDIEFDERVVNTRILHIDSIKAFAETMSMLDADWKEDARLVRQTKDLLQNAVYNGGYGGTGAVNQQAVQAHQRAQSTPSQSGGSGGSVGSGGSRISLYFNRLD